mmetsp:Transcript_28326/g.62197  ORF Transcript_28326/g.62197 Transcript_28326/m.62197 type:complete len:203 (+) Transcript_28326:989-1597(+)
MMPYAPEMWGKHTAHTFTRWKSIPTEVEAYTMHHVHMPAHHEDPCRPMHGLLTGIVAEAMAWFRGTGVLVRLPLVVGAQTLDAKAWHSVGLAVRLLVSMLCQGVHHHCTGWCVDLQPVWPVVVVAWLRPECGIVVLSHVAVAAKHLLVTAQHHLVLSPLLAAHTVVCVGVGWVEVEDKQQVTALHNNHLVTVALAADPLVRR